MGNSTSILVAYKSKQMRKGYNTSCLAALRLITIWESREEPAAMLEGIILAGGSGTCLNPIDKPMIYYQLSTLMLAGISSELSTTGANMRRCTQTAKAVVEMAYPRAKSCRQIPRAIREKLIQRSISLYGSQAASAA
jgi:hypothetical protein